MAFNFKDLDQVTREHMLAEVQRDIQKDTLYKSKDFNAQGEAFYPDVIVRAVKSGTEETMAAELPKEQYFKEKRAPNAKGIEQSVPYTAPVTFSEGEFNRFYIRALCLRAIDEAREIVVYRARHSENARSASEALIGRSFDPNKVLEDLRANPGVDTAFGLPPGPNSGLSVFLR